jgi:diguanylate cyclase (GGDEF)-like protein
MDILSLPLTSGIPRNPGDRPFAAHTGRDTTDGPAPGAAPDPTAASSGIARRELVLRTYTAVSIAAGLLALAWTTFAVPILPAIDPALPDSALAGPSGGMLLWIAYGFIGSLRVLPIPGASGVWTFHLPFIAAAMVLGGPTAGAWVAFLSTIERRELSSQPWYGALANHAVLAFAAVMGGLAVQAIAAGLAMTSVQPAAASLVAITAGTFLLAMIANVVAAGTIALREGLPATGVLDILIRSIGPVTLGEIALAWVFVVAYSTVGWWAPLVLSGAILLAWPREDAEFLDPMTGLPRRGAFSRELDATLARTRRGLAPGGLLLVIDLKDFGVINKVPGLGMEIGDAVMAEVGARLRGVVRAADLVARWGGDEFAIFYTGVVDEATARRMTNRIEAAMKRGFETPAGMQFIGVSIGALIVRPAADIPSRETLMGWAETVMQKGKRFQHAHDERTATRFHRYGRLPAGSDATAQADGRHRPLRLPATVVRVLALALATVAVLIVGLGMALRLLG